MSVNYWSRRCSRGEGRGVEQASGRRSGSRSGASNCSPRAFDILSFTPGTPVIVRSFTTRRIPGPRSSTPRSPIPHRIEASLGQVHIHRLLVAIAYCLVFIPVRTLFLFTSSASIPCSCRTLRCGGPPLSYSLHMTLPRAVRRDDSLFCSAIPSHPHPPVTMIT